MDLLEKLSRLASPDFDLSGMPVKPPRAPNAPRELAEIASEPLFPPDMDSVQDAPKRMAYSRTMKDLIGGQYLAESQAADPFPFYPSDKHLQKNLAPEKTLGRKELERLKSARNKAIEMEVLDPELADYMLPIAMVEGRPNSYGIMHDNKFYASPTNKRLFAQMGIPLEDLSKHYDRGEEVPQNTAPPFYIAKDKRGDKFIHFGQGADQYKPELMAVILAIKNQGSSGIHETLERWNGAGEQARHHREKVMRASELLDHPKNLELMKSWRRD